jgi:hypothetical protein
MADRQQSRTSAAKEPYAISFATTVASADRGLGPRQLAHALALLRRAASCASEPAVREEAA